MTFIDARASAARTGYKAVAPSQDPDLGCTAWDCDMPADADAPAPLCPAHLQRAFIYMLGKVEARSGGVAEDRQIPAPRWPMPNKDTDGWVYFARFGELIKIGWSSNPGHRFRQLRPDAVLHTEPGKMIDEQRAHKAFAHLRVHGEYFRAGPDLMKFIEDLRRVA